MATMLPPPPLTRVGGPRAPSLFCVVIVSHGAGHAPLQACCLALTLGQRVQGCLPIGIGTKASVIAFVVDEGGGPGGVLLVLGGEWGRWGVGLTGWSSPLSSLHPLLTLLLPLHLLLRCPRARWEAAGWLRIMAVQGGGIGREWMVRSTQLIGPYLDPSQCDTISLKYFVPHIFVFTIKDFISF